MRIILSLAIPHDGLSLLMSASILEPHHDLVCDLLRHRASPNHQITVTYQGNPNRIQRTTIWTIFLTLELSDQNTGSIWQRATQHFGAWFLVLEGFLKSGANGNVYFFFKLEEHDEEHACFMTLEDFILKCQPPNIETLLG
jgi:hypothetical protein